MVSWMMIILHAEHALYKNLSTTQNESPPPPIVFDLDFCTTYALHQHICIDV